MKLSDISNDVKVKFKSRKEIRRILIEILEDNKTDEAVDLASDLSDILHDYSYGVIKSGLDIYLDDIILPMEDEIFNVEYRNESEPFLFENVIIHNSTHTLFVNNKLLKKIK